MRAPLAARADVRGIRAGGRVSANRSGAAHAVWNSVRGATAEFRRHACAGDARGAPHDIADIACAGGSVLSLIDRRAGRSRSACHALCGCRSTVRRAGAMCPPPLG